MEEIQKEYRDELFHLNLLLTEITNSPKIKNVADYYLLYATNTSTGNEGYYLYDKLENSVQRYNSDMLNSLTEEKDKYFSLVLVLSSVCFLTMLFLLIQVNRSNKSKNEA